MPQFSEDDVVNFMVNEAMIHRAREQAEKAEKERERENHMRSHKDFDPFKTPSPGG